MTPSLATPPNILYLHVHDAGRYVQPYGYPVATPNLQRFAEQGVLYRQAFCANPTCSASRSALLTGTYPHQNGMLGLAHRGFRLHTPRHHLCHLLRDAGYTTALAGVQHLTTNPDGPTTELGYDNFLTKESGFEPPVAAAETYFQQKRSQPFFLSVGFFAPHRDGQEGFPTNRPASNPNYVRPPAILPDTPETRQDFADYSASITSVDESIGRVLTALDQADLTKQTLVIITTDHGIAFPGMKCNLTDHGIGVMLMIRGPGGFSGGQVNDDLVSQVDLVPTLLELINRPIPDHVQGRSFLNAPPREEIFAEVNVHASIEPQRTVRTKRWKYIRRYADRPAVVLSNCDNSLSKTLWQKSGWSQQPVATEQLYDLVFDPMERHNLAASPDHAAVKTELATTLDRWQRETDDPLLTGPLPLPPDAIIVPIDRYSPQDVD